MTTRSELDHHAMRLIGSLQFDPGFLLLLDLLQAKLDDLTDELGETKNDEREAVLKLKYWQAFREILNTLRIAPMNFAETIKQEPENKPEELLTAEDTWARYNRAAKMYGLDETGNPVEY